MGHFSPFFIQKNFNKQAKPKMELAERRDFSSETNLQDLAISLNQTSWNSVYSVTAGNSPASREAMQSAYDTHSIIFHEKFNAFFPMKKKRVLINKAEGNPWFTAKVREAQRRDDKLYRKKLNNPTPENISNYKESHKSFKKLINISKNDYINRKIVDT